MQTRPAIAGRYRLQEKLGSGGMGEVWRAMDDMLERPVAVKLLKDVDDPSQAERFRREALSTAAVHHDDVVSIYDAGVERHQDGSSLVYLVMELLDGPTLAEALEQHGRMPVDLALRLAGQVADALAAAHQAGVVHRDIKPANLMFDGNQRLTVLDFGIAAVAASDQAGLTATGMVIGSPAYLSPEQAAAQHIGPATDVYSLGCVLFEMLTGRPPYTDAHPLAVLHQHVAAPVPHVNEYADVPAYVDRLVTSMLAKNPAARPTAEQAARSLSSPAVPGMEEATEVMRTRPADRPLSTPLALPTNPTRPVEPRPSPRPAAPPLRRERPFPVGRLIGALVVVVLCIFAISALASIDPSSSSSSHTNGLGLPKWNDDSPSPKDNLDKLDEWRRRAERFHVISHEKSQEWKDKIDQVRELQQKGEDTQDKIDELRDQMKKFSD
ncbi:MAG: serine/threonine protein kinase [Nocardioides sp.]|nr:serine/threonine protein kinase [Nocardioides sp.]